MPCAFSSSRMRSASAKFLAFLASARARISASTSALASPFSLTTANSPAAGAVACLARRAAAFSSSFRPSTVSKLSSRASLVLSLVLAFSTSYSTVTAIEVFKSLSMAAMNLALYSSKAARSTSPSSFSAAILLSSLL